MVIIGIIAYIKGTDLSNMINIPDNNNESRHFIEEEMELIDIRPKKDEL